MLIFPAALLVDSPDLMFSALKTRKQGTTVEIRVASGSFSSATRAPKPPKEWANQSKESKPSSLLHSRVLCTCCGAPASRAQALAAVHFCKSCDKAQACAGWKEPPKPRHSILSHRTLRRNRINQGLHAILGMPWRRQKSRKESNLTLPRGSSQAWRPWRVNSAKVSCSWAWLKLCISFANLDMKGPLKEETQDS